MRPLLDAKEAAETLNISPRYLWTLTNSLKITHVRQGKKLFYRPEALEQWVESNTVAAAK